MTATIESEPTGEQAFTIKRRYVNNVTPSLCSYEPVPANAAAVADPYTRL